MLTVEESGITCSQKERKASFAWDEVPRISAFEKDLLTTDCICVCIELENGSCVFDEDTTGFMDVVEVMQKRFPSIPPDWLPEIAVPAFETNLRVLYQVEDAG